MPVFPDSDDSIILYYFRASATVKTHIFDEKPIFWTAFERKPIQTHTIFYIEPLSSNPTRFFNLPPESTQKSLANESALTVVKAGG
jgi:hypothetical protein